MADRTRKAQVLRERWTLTDREAEIAEQVALGLTNDQIARKLYVTTDTVKKHLTNIFTKTDCTNRTQLALICNQDSHTNWK